MNSDVTNNAPPTIGQTADAERAEPTRPAIEALTFGAPNRLIRASAGTGKTFQLSNRYLELVLSGHAPERILATTFTRKAAGEILERIAYRLATATVDEAATQNLADQLGMPELTLPHCRSVLRMITGRLHRLRVSTLDSFFLQATQALSLELGLPPGWTISNEVEDGQIQAEALRAVLDDEDPSTLLQLLSWLAKGETTRGVFRTLTDAVTTMYVTYLDAAPTAWKKLKRKPGLDDQQLIAITEAWQDWTVPSSGVEANCDKRLATAVNKLRAKVVAGDWSSIVSEALAKTVVDGANLYYKKPIPSQLVQQIQQVVDHAQAEVCNRVQQQTEASFELLDRFHRKYESLKLQRRVLRFSDLSRFLTRADSANNLGSLAFRMDSSIDSLLLDEFQDTSREQWSVLRPFADHAAQAKLNHSFLCVGDTKQAIYGWRGGNADLLDVIPQELPNVVDGCLDRSFRSSPVVIDAVNRINQALKSHPNLGRAEPAAKNWCENFPVHDTSRTQLEGYVTIETSEPSRDADGHRAMAVARTVQRVSQIRRDAPTSSIAVLVRTNALVGKTIFALQAAGIPASEEGGNPLTDSAAVQLVISLLILADRPHDTAAFFHLQTSPWATQLGLRPSRVHGTPDEAHSAAHRSQREQLSAARRLAARVARELADVGFGQVVARWASELQPFCNPRELRRLMQLTELAVSYQRSVESPRAIGHRHQRREPLRTVGFVALIESHRVADPTEDPVRVMNIHQSKGLQFDCVILPDLERTLTGQTPTCVTRRNRPTDELDAVVRFVKKDARDAFPKEIRTVHEDHERLAVREELCVLYVGLTRAVHALHMIIAPTVDATDETVDGSGAPGEPAKPKQRDLRADLSSLIRHAFVGDTPLAPESIVFELGNPRWWQPPAVADAAVQPKSWLPPSTDMSRLAQRRARLRKFGHVHAASGRGGTPIRPSQLEGGGRVDLKRVFGSTNQQAMLRGTLIHAYFEQIGWLEDGVPTDSDLESLAVTHQASRRLIKESITAFRDMLNQPIVRRILSRSAYPRWQDQLGDSRFRMEVRCEQAISVLNMDGWISGNIDRLALLTRDEVPIAADIVDFKTDRVSSDDSQRIRNLAAHYRPQLDAYRRGISHMLQLPASQISTGLVLLEADVVMRSDA